MSQSNKEKKRGTKRNAADLLSTDHQADNAKNPRAAKRQRINEKQAMAINTLLSLPMDQIQALPEPLKKQALALRAPDCSQNNENIDVGLNGTALSLKFDSTTNNNNQNKKDDMLDVVDQDSLHSESASSSDVEEQDNSFLHDGCSQSKKQETVTHRKIPQQSQPIQRDQQQPFVSNSNNQHIPPRREASDTFNSFSAKSHSSGNTNLFAVSSAASHPLQLAQPKYQYQRPQDIRISQLPPFIAHEVGNQGLRFDSVDSKQMDTGSGRSCFCGFICCFLLTVTVLAFVSMLLYGGGNGTRFCDTNSKVIKAYNDTKCTPCPSTALYCVEGKAVCPDRSYWMNPDLECVKRNVRDSLLQPFKTVRLHCAEFARKLRDFLGKQARAWSSTKKWKQWWNKMTFEQFCRDYEMEIMMSFFVVSWHLPCLRYLVIAIWARMVLTALNGKDELLLRVALWLLVYFCPIMFGKLIWNKIVSFFSEK